MKFGRSTIVLLAAFLVLIAAVFVCYVVFPAGFGHALFSDAVISKKTASSIQVIEISGAVDRFPVILEKKDSRWWLCLDDTHRYPAQSNKIETFLAILSAKQSVYSAGSNDGPQYGIGGKDSYVLRLLKDRNTPVVNLVFGNTSAAGTDIFFCNDPQQGNSSAPYKNVPVMRTRDTFTTYLETGTSFWADLGVFRTIASASEIERIVCEGENGVKKFTAGKNREVQAFAQVLASLQCIAITNIPLSPEEIITVELGDTSSVRLGIAELDATTEILTDLASGNSYIISKLTRNDMERALGVK